jgi:hypothetical protein
VAFLRRTRETYDAVSNLRRTVISRVDDPRERPPSRDPEYRLATARWSALPPGSGYRGPIPGLMAATGATDHVSLVFDNPTPSIA